MHREVPIFSDVVAFMEFKFTKYSEKIPTVYYIAIVLDPHMKFGGIELLIRKIAEKFCVKISISIEDVRHRITLMFEYYSQTH